ncbi:MAG: 30S ribosomal protein S6 [Erysipelothrix sp.]|nr:30S ribosomal protein S6 [Erysipelothrix sp.]
MRKYELMYIVNASLDEETRQGLIDNLKNQVERNQGVVSDVTEMGMRDFAYEIDHMTKGFYVLMTFEADVETVVELERIMRLNRSIIRHMNVRLDEE